MHHPARVRNASLVTLALIAAACATPVSQVRVDQAEGGLPPCQTFAWHATSGDAASFTDQRVKAATLQALKDKGYTEVTDKPDCRIAYSLATHEIPQSRPGVGVGVGGGSGGLGGGLGVSIPVGRRKGFTGTLTLDIIDAGKNAQVWSGSVDANLDVQEITAEEANALVAKVLAAYPDRSNR